jgi:oxygen-dependent protoporphyrinogen oxidase
MSKRSVAVIGGGLTGLSVATALSRSGHEPVVLERMDRPGGVIRSARVDGFLCEDGPNSMMLKSRAVEEFLAAAGLSPDIVEANREATRRYLVKDGRPVALPASPIEAITTPLYSAAAKFRVLAEPFVGPPEPGEEDSVATFVTRRLGREFLDYGIAPLVSGIFAGDPERLSIRYAFPKIWQLEDRYGSLIGGAVKMRRERKRAGEVPYKGRIIAFREGLEMLPARLAGGLGDLLRLEARVTEIRKTATGWSISWEDRAGSQTREAASLVCTAPPVAWNTLPWPDDLAAAIARIPIPAYPPVATMMLGYRRDQVRHPLDGFGMLIPLAEQRRILGVIFSSTLFPGRAPEGCVTLMIFIGGATAPQRAVQDEAQRYRDVAEELSDLLGITGEPLMTRHTLWPEAIPQYTLGYGNFYSAMASVERRWPGLHFQGNFRDGPGVSDCITNSLELADRLIS